MNLTIDSLLPPIRRPRRGPAARAGRRRPTLALLASTAPVALVALGALAGWRHVAAPRAAAATTTTPGQSAAPVVDTSVPAASSIRFDEVDDPTPVRTF
jgi:hypothetical protein